MYQSPDVIKVKVNVEDVFASYGGGCPMDEYGQWRWTSPCEGTSDYAFDGDTYVGLNWGFECYSTKNP